VRVRKTPKRQAHITVREVLIIALLYSCGEMTELLVVGEDDSCVVDGIVIGGGGGPRKAGDNLVVLGVYGTTVISLGG